MDLASLRIGFIAGTLGQGGAEHQLFYILRALRAAGAQPFLLCLTRGEYWEEPLRTLGVPVQWVGQSGARWRRLLAIARAVRGRSLDILQSHHFYTNLYAVLAARAFRTREIGAIRNDVISEVRDGGRLGGPLSLHMPRHLIANSQAAVATATARGVPPARLRYLPNVVDTDVFRPCPRPRRGPVRLLVAGRLTHQKRVDRFLNILATVRKQARVDLHAVVLGEGPLRGKLEAQVQELDLGQAVEFAGLQPDLVPFYASCDIFVSTSDYEGTPNVVLEAMACGLPVVSTAVGGVPEIIRNGETGLLVDRENKDEMCDLVLDLVHAPEKRNALGRRAREFVETYHSLAQLPLSLEQTYSYFSALDGRSL